MKHANTFDSALSSACERLGVQLTSEQREAMLAHWRLVQQWQQRVNLTALETDVDAAFFHYADSLAALPHLRPGAVLDIGSGAGFPGIPIAIADPSRRVVLLEPRRKRATFLEVCAARLGLKNVAVRHGASTDAPTESFANVLTRATFSDPAELESCRAWVAKGGMLVAYRSSPLDGIRSVSYALGDETRFLVEWIVEDPK